MNFQLLVTLLAFFQIIVAVPIPIPIAEPATVTTIIPVARVIIHNGSTTTIQLTTLTDDQLSSATPTQTPTSTTTTPPSSVTTTFISTDANGIAHVWVTVVVHKTVLVDGNGIPYTTIQGYNTMTNLVNYANVGGAGTTTVSSLSASANANANIGNVSFGDNTTIITKTTRDLVNNDNVKVATTATTITTANLVANNNTGVTTNDIEITTADLVNNANVNGSASASITTTIDNDNTSLTDSTENVATTTTAAAQVSNDSAENVVTDVTTSSADLVGNVNVQGTTSNSLSTSFKADSTTVGANKDVQNAQTTATPTTSETTTSITSKELYSTPSYSVTTWSNGEVFYSILPDTLVDSNVAVPIVAATTTTLSNVAEFETTSTGSLSLVSSDSKLLLPTLTEGLPKDKNVAATMVNPATVPVTNTDITTTSVVVTTPTLSSTSTSSSSLSPSSSSSSSSSSSGLSSSSFTSLSSTTSTSSFSSSDSLSSTTSTQLEAAASAASDIDSSRFLTKVPFSIVYSPYNDDGTCKNYQSVLTDLELIQSKGIQEIRIYGTDCNYMTTVLSVSKLLGLKVNQGFWISQAGADSIDTAVTDLITYISSGAASYGWEIFSYFTIGNEAIIANYCSVSDLINKISEVKGKLQAAGYTGLVTTAEPPVSYENNPELCTASVIDFVGINPHSYFDAYSAAEDAGVFVAGQIGIVRQYCGDKRIVVTETGYPNAGIQNGKNIPSVDNQRIAVQSILDVVGTDVTILTTFEDLWKSPGAYGIEQSFGIIQLLP